jgi:hypothetical protein
VGEVLIDILFKRNHVISVHLFLSNISDAKKTQIKNIRINTGTKIKLNFGGAQFFFFLFKLREEIFIIHKRYLSVSK